MKKEVLEKELEKLPAISKNSYNLNQIIKEELATDKKKDLALSKAVQLGCYNTLYKIIHSDEIKDRKLSTIIALLICLVEDNLDPLEKQKKIVQWLIQIIIQIDIPTE